MSGRHKAAPVRALPYDELAVALYASPMPTASKYGTVSAEQIETWAAEGLARLGAVQVWRLSFRSRHGTGPEHRAIWPSPRRATTAHSLAFRYLSAREAEGHPWPTYGGYVTVPAAPLDSTATWLATYCHRDMELAGRHGWPSSVLVDADAATADSS